jgi:hypothetical protein
LQADCDNLINVKNGGDFTLGLASLIHAFYSIELPFDVANGILNFLSLFLTEFSDAGNLLPEWKKIFGMIQQSLLEGNFFKKADSREFDYFSVP